MMELTKKYDFTFFGIAGGIFLIGILNLYSATHSDPDPSVASLYKSQLVWFFIAMAVGFVISFLRPKSFLDSAYIIYFINVILLLLVMIIGKRSLGAQRWLALGPIRFQPSEIMKITLVLTLGRWFFKFNPEQELGLKQLVIPGIIAFVPAILVVAQPDLGTGMLLILVFFTMCFYRRLKWKSITLIGLLGILASTGMYHFALKDYQKKRIHTFIDPDQDVKGYGYNAIQSKIAIGSGKLLGKGFRKSSQASLQYLPENHTDFIFAVFNEEHGFFGAIVVIALYLILFLKILWLVNMASGFFEALLTMGVLAIFFWHTFINMGMVMGLLPIVGIPLPLMSYGGSSLLTFGVCLGMITSISNNRTFF